MELDITVHHFCTVIEVVLVSSSRHKFVHEVTLTNCWKFKITLLEYQSNGVTFIPYFVNIGPLF
jgi:hypothetical protein